MIVLKYFMFIMEEYIYYNKYYSARSNDIISTKDILILFYSRP